MYTEFYTVSHSDADAMNRLNKRVNHLLAEGASNLQVVRETSGAYLLRVIISYDLEGLQPPVVVEGSDEHKSRNLGVF